MVTHMSHLGGRRKAISGRSGCIFQKVCPVRAAGVSSFQTQSTGEGSRGGSVPPQTPQSCRAVLPPAGCEHATWAHVLCCGIGENGCHHTCPPTAESQSKKNSKKVEAVLQPGEELDPQRRSVTQSRGSPFLSSRVFFDSGESMKNYPIGEGQGYRDMAPVLGKLRGWRRPRACRQRTCA